MPPSASAPLLPSHYSLEPHSHDSQIGHHRMLGLEKTAWTGWSNRSPLERRNVKPEERRAYLICSVVQSSCPLQHTCLENAMDGGAWWAAVYRVARSQTRLSDFTFMFHFHALEKEMATHSSVLAWRIPGMGEPGGLPSMGSHRVGHDWSDLAAAAAESSCLFSLCCLYTPLCGRRILKFSR